MTEIAVECPNCKTRFDVEEVIKAKLESSIKQEYDKSMLEYRQRIDAERSAIEKERSAILQQKENFDELIATKLDERLNIERENLKKELLVDYQDKLIQAESTVKAMREENFELKRKELELMKIRQEYDDLNKQHKLELETKLLEQRRQLQIEADDAMKIHYELRLREAEKKLEAQKKLAEEMQKKVEQGSMQLQGEVQELAIEDYLRANYPFDLIQHVPVGKSGADIIQKVRDTLSQECGIIAYESKRTQHFSKEWLKKLKDDMLAVKADIGILVTRSLPQGWKGFTNIDGVWVCSYSEFENVVAVMREMLISISRVRKQEINRSDAKELMYNYLTSNEFKQRVTQIIENFNRMKDGLNKEKAQVLKLWAMREKQIESIVTGMSEMFGAIRGYSMQSLEDSDFMVLESYEEKE